MAGGSGGGVSPCGEEEVEGGVDASVDDLGLEEAHSLRLCEGTRSGCGLYGWSATAVNRQGGHYGLQE